VLCQCTPGTAWPEGGSGRVGGDVLASCLFADGFGDNVGDAFVNGEGMTWGRGARRGRDDLGEHIPPLDDREHDAEPFRMYWLIRISTGRPVNDSAYDKALVKVCASAEVPRVSSHALRHTYVSWMNMRGVASDATHRRMCNPHGRPRSAFLASSPFVLSEHSARRSAWSGAGSAPRDATDATSRRPDPCHWLHHRCTNVTGIVPRSTPPRRRRGARSGPLQLQSSISRAGGSRRSLSVLVDHLPGSP
jgi:hypothetical protein